MNSHIKTQLNPYVGTVQITQLGKTAETDRVNADAAKTTPASPKGKGRDS